MNSSKRSPSAVAGPRSSRESSRVYSTFVPFLMVLIILILSSTRDSLRLLKRKNELNAAQAQAMGPLVYARKQAEYIQSIRDDLARLAPTDSSLRTDSRGFLSTSTNLFSRE